MTTAAITVADLRSASSLDSLLVLLRNLPSELPIWIERELSRLKTFGGRAPRQTFGVWSWDSTRRLVVGNRTGGGWEIEPRPTCEAAGCSLVADVPGAGGGRCPTHYQQRRRRGETKPVRVPAAARVGVRVSAEALERLTSEGSPAVVARRVIEDWAARR